MVVNKKTPPEGFTPYGVVARQHESTPPLDWKLWGSMYDVELWQAAALSLNINPDTIKDPIKFNHGNFKDRLRLLENWLPNNNHLMLCELAGKWSKIFKWQIPPELAAKARLYDELTITESAVPAAPAAKGAMLPDTSPSSDEVEEQTPVADDHDETLAGLFDPVPVEALAKMFMIDLAQWKKWQES